MQPGICQASGSLVGQLERECVLQVNNKQLKPTHALQDSLRQVWLIKGRAKERILLSKAGETDNSEEC